MTLTLPDEFFKSIDSVLQMCYTLANHCPFFLPTKFDIMTTMNQMYQLVREITEIYEKY